MKRRTFIAGLGSAAAWPLVARGQQPERMRRIGVLMNLTADDPEIPARFNALAQGLQQFGWIVGRNVQIDYRFGAIDADGSRRYATELVALAPDLILAVGIPAVFALQQATRTVPIVFVNTIDPVGAGLVDSLAQPGGNVRIRNQREMAGAAQRDRASADASGGPSGRRHPLWDRPVGHNTSSGPVIRSGRAARRCARY